jgi:hypothetical protein
MPPKRSQNARKSSEQEGRISLAILALKNHEISSIREAARLYSVPYTTLTARYHGRAFRLEQRPKGYKLTQIEEETLLQWILSMDQRGAAPRPAMVGEMANILLEERCQQTVGQNWVYKFVQRHDRIKTRFSRRYNHERAKCEDPKIIQKWFDLVRQTIDENGILDDDIYNFDETGFAMGLIATTKVVTRAEYYGRRHLLQPGNREWVTSIETINATGWVLPPYIIFKGHVHIEAWYQDQALLQDWRIDISNNGWTTDEIGLSWLQNHFIPLTCHRTKGKYRLLIMDGHGSHLAPQFDRICSENNIIPICMPPHSSHLLQPLDIGCFSILKRAYGGLVEQRMRIGINHIDKIDFLTAFPHARAETYKSTTIQNGFAASGIVPYDPDRVISQLNIRLKSPTPPGSSSSAWSPKTPHNVKQLTRQASSIKALLQRRSRSPPTPSKSRLDQLIKGSERAMHQVALLTRELHDLRAANEKQKQKRKRSQKQLSHTGGILVQEAHELFNRPNQGGEASNSTPTETDAIASRPAIRAPPKCSECGIQGHNRTRCPNLINA